MIVLPQIDEVIFFIIFPSPKVTLPSFEIKGRGTVHLSLVALVLLVLIRDPFCFRMVVLCEAASCTKLFHILELCNISLI